MHLGLRKLLMTSLLAAFGIQTALVYGDDTADRIGPLSAEAVAGRRIWHRHNCQVCHQIYGFGGFLGPDLTNAAQRLTRQRLDEVLTRGTGEMPAFHLGPEEITQVQTFLQELDRTGVGVARRGAPLEPAKVHAAVEAALQELPAEHPARRGWQTFRTTCTTCHVPLQATALGLNTSADLTTVFTRLDEAGVRQAITEGRGSRGMPAWSLGERLDDVVALLRWLGEQRPALARAVGGVDRPQSLPWWTYQ